MTTDDRRPARPVSRTEELVLAEASDLPPEAGDRRDAIAKVLEAERRLDPRGRR